MQTDLSGVKPEHFERIRECFPGLNISSVRTDRGGLINDVVIVNEELVFRFPKNDTWARDLLADEIKVLNLVRKYVDMPVPTFELQSEDLVVYKFIKGRALQRGDILALGEAAQDRIAEQLATFLRQLHSVPADELRRHDIPQSDVNRSHDIWVRLFEDVGRELFPLMMAHTKEWVERHFEPVLNDEGWMNYTPTLINGDVTPYHILYDREEKRVNGIIDFGTAGIGDPAADFSCIIYSYGESFLRRMSKSYPEVGKSVERARFWAGSLELQWALKGLRSKDGTWFMVHIGSARDVSPIGSGWK